MTPTIRFCLVLHNHQPIGNFDGVFEQAYQDSYLPFLDVFEPYEHLKISLHTSGPLLEWMDEKHPEYLDRVAALVAAGRIEIVGGAFYEPILTMIPSRDRVGQIGQFTQWLENRFGGSVQGMWVPERVWEQALTSDIAEAGIRYTVLDDFHFRNAGLNPNDLFGYFVSEDDGRTIGIFPGSERLRYLIPFGAPHETIDYLRGVAEHHPGAAVVFGDDGEKFGTWPDTKKHVYDDGWLRTFFDLLTENRHWISTTTLATAVEETPPSGKVYLPDASYREMTEWAMPVERQLEYDTLVHEMEHEARWPRLQKFIRGGFWRNFRVRYPEANEMYSRMLMVSTRLNRLENQPDNDVSAELLQQARRALYRGQCNCSYWHGAFGGIYLPHLRNAVYKQLILADNLLDQAEAKPDTWVEATADDYNFDMRQEVRLANDKLVCLLAPSAGGQMYELDVREICHNLLATLTRRPEAYHRKVLAGANPDASNVASIHDRVVFKQEGLDQRLQYDRTPRKSLIDAFYDEAATLQAVQSGEVEQLGNFVDARYETRLRKDPDRIQVLQSHSGQVDGHPVKVSKGVTLQAGLSSLQIVYLLEGLPQDRNLHFGVEFNFAGLPSGADDRYYYTLEGEGSEQRLGHLGTALDLSDFLGIGMVDEWLGIDVRFRSNQVGGLWAFPVETVSQSEGGFELVHQSIALQPHWFVRGDRDGRWSVTLDLEFDTTRARERLLEAEGLTGVRG